MQHQAPFGAASNAAADLSSGAYARLLHPRDAVGQVSLMVIPSKEEASTRTYRLDELEFAVGATLDHAAYLSLNRFYGPRSGARLAQLNALYLDLDFHRLPGWSEEDWSSVAVRFGAGAAAHGLPQPSVLMHTGRGLAAVWLIDPIPRRALSRWSATMVALIDLHRGLGADSSASDAARIFRLPGTINPKSGREVRTLSGTLQRYPFDTLSDLVFRAAGRPTREELQQRRERKAKGPSKPASRGLTPRMRFEAIQRDLERLLTSWGGRVPEGRRNIWLHLFGTCLTHVAPVAEIETRLRATAAIAAPGIQESELKALIKSVLTRAEKATSSAPAGDGRYHYSGDKIAELLDVDGGRARALGLEQVVPKAERRRWKAEKERQRRQAAGSISRDDYLAQNTTSREKPWLAEGISERTWYRRRAAARRRTS